MVSKNTLIVIAGVVWVIAGVNVLAIGIQAFATQSMPLVLALVAGAVVIFAAFFAMFSRLVKKNVARISAMTAEKIMFLNFLNGRSWAIMAFMMALGFGLRFSGVAPDWFIAFFYTGLGTALTVAGILFFVNRFKGVAR